MDNFEKDDAERKALDAAIDSQIPKETTDLFWLRIPEKLAHYLALRGLDAAQILEDYVNNKLSEQPSVDDEFLEPVRKPMLIRADALINGERQADYGDKLQNFAQIAMGFQMILATKLQKDAEITAEDVALCMMQVKMARLTKSPDHKDSILDVAGYAGCYDKIQEEREQNYPLKGATYDAGARKA